VSYVLKSLDDLMPAPYNPRKITADALAGLADSVTEYGDLSGLVWNAQTSRLVCGHQRLEALKQRYGAGLAFDAATDRPGASPAIVTPDGQRFSVRVVDWPEDREQLGRVCYGMEIEPKYVAVCLQRMKDMGLEPALTEASPDAHPDV
jgi:hypothetical protein